MPQGTPTPTSAGGGRISPGLRIAPEGWPFVLAGLALAAILGFLGWSLLPLGAPVRLPLQVAAFLVGALALFSAYFFRDPVRVPPLAPDLVLAPADGRIISIEAVQEPTVLDGRATRISTFLNIFNVHVQRAPVSGTVVYRAYKPGRYLAAWNPKASEENEQASLGIASGPDRLLVRQIAGLVARRVVTDPDEGQGVQAGERIGLIRFGSRVDLFLPTHWEICCKEGDRARASVTVLARMPRAEGSGSREEGTT